MPRVKRGTVRRANRKKLSKITKGFFLTKSKLYRSMKEAADKAGRYAFRDRRRKKRDFRRLWILRISAAARANGVTYSQLIHGLKALAVEIDRKMLAEMSVTGVQTCALPIYWSVRRRKKRDFRRLWILRISAAARSNGVTYSQLIHGLKAQAIEIDRKMLAEMAVKDQHAFAELAAKVKATITEPQRVPAAS